MFTVTAVYKDGVLVPTTRLDLPNDATVKLQIVTLPVASAGFGSLAGIWERLSDDDVAQMEQTIASRRQQSADKAQHLSHEVD